MLEATIPIYPLSQPQKGVDRAGLVISNSPNAKALEGLKFFSAGPKRLWHLINLGMVDPTPYANQPDYRKESFLALARKDAEERGLICDPVVPLFNQHCLRMGPEYEIKLREHYRHLGDLIGSRECPEFQHMDAVYIDARTEAMPVQRAAAGAERDLAIFYRKAKDRLGQFRIGVADRVPICLNSWGDTALTADASDAAGFKGESFYNLGNRFKHEYEGYGRLLQYEAATIDAIKNPACKDFVFHVTPYLHGNVAQWLMASAIVYRKMQLLGEVHDCRVWWFCNLPLHPEWDSADRSEIDWRVYPRVRRMLERDDLYIDQWGLVSDGEHSWSVKAEGEFIWPERRDV